MNLYLLWAAVKINDSPDTFSLKGFLSQNDWVQKGVESESHSGRVNRIQNSPFLA